MGQSPKPIALSTAKISKEERAKRERAEASLKGKSDKLRPPTYLTKGAKKIFKYIVNELVESGVMGNVDIFLITQTAIALDEYKSLEIEKQQTMDREERKAIRKEQDMLVKQNKSNFTELGLSPASRGRLASLQVQRQEEAKDPLLQALKELKGE